MGIRRITWRSLHEFFDSGVFRGFVEDSEKSGMDDRTQPWAS